MKNLKRCYLQSALIFRLVNSWLRKWMFWNQMTLTRAVHVINVMVINYHHRISLGYLILTSTVSVAFTIGYSY